MNRKNKIFIIDDDRDVLLSARLFLESHYSHIECIHHPSEIRNIQPGRSDIILLDMNFLKGETDGKAGLKYLNYFESNFPDCMVILMTAFGDTDLTVRGIKEGAFDFILKPWKNAKLLSSIQAAIKHQEAKNDLKIEKERNRLLTREIDQHYPDIIGSSAQIVQLKEQIRRVAYSDANILITGENGTGKELVARAIHNQSARKEKAMISVDMASLPESLFESEMFGHKKGAFTDAKTDKTGRFELAHKGSIFLDEISNIPLSIQAKLLDTLERKRVIPLGSSEPISIDCRIISASNKDLHELIHRKQFREDLYYRLNTIELNIPPLRQRKDDIACIVDFYLKKYQKKYNKTGIKLGKKELNLLEKHSWPGNIRELKNCIERTVVLSKPGEIILNTMDESSPIMSDYKELNLEDMEKKLIRKALLKNRGNITQAAKDLGLKRNALYRRMEKYEL